MFKRAAVGILGVLFVISPSAASALTPPPPDDYGDGDTPTGIYCPDLKQTLKRGSRDRQTSPPGQVSELQIFLSDYYGIDEEEIVTGYFGAFTHRTVVRFQTEQGLPAFGIVGVLTRAKIKEVCGGGIVTPLPPPPTGQSLTVTSVVPVNTGNIVNIQFAGLPAGWNIRIIGVSGAANPLPVSTLGILPVPGSYTGNAVESINVTPGATFYALHIPNGTPAGSYIVEVSSPNDGWLIKLRTPAFWIGGSVTPTPAVSVNITAPNEEAYVYYGDSLTVSWIQTGSVPKESKACVYLKNESTGNFFAFPASGSCVSIAGQEPIRSVTGTLLRNAGYDLAPGAYRAVVHLIAPPPGDGKDGPLLATDQSDKYFKLLEKASSSAINVTAPNGGETWEIGVMNTITWKPYGYNPDINPPSQITAYLVHTNGKKERIIPSGKASIHWEGQVTWADYSNTDAHFPTPGQYYIEVVNNVTGARDRSDAPFTLVGKSVDLKLNGSDGPLSVDTTRPVTASWTANNVARCEIHNAYPDASRQVQVGAVPTSGSRQVYLNHQFGPTLYCYKNDGAAVYDSVQINPQTIAASVQVLSPNGGESFDPTTSMTVNWSQSGVRSASLALYRNDQFYGWIAKDVVSGDGKQQHTWTPNQLMPIIPNEGAVYKIYITALRADGNGYVDDKSDAAFSFGQIVSSLPAAPASWKPYQFRAVNTSTACTGEKYVGYSAKYDKWVGAQHCGSADKYKLYMSQTETGTYYQIADYGGHGQDHCELVNPSFTSLPNDDDITSGGCTTCAVGGVIDVQNESVFARSRLGELFKLVVSGYWGDLTTDYYKCGVSIGTVASTPSGTLTLSIDASTPQYQIVPGGTAGITLAAYRLRAAGESIKLQKMGVTLTNGKPTDTTTLYFYNGSTLLGTTLFPGNSTLAVATLNTPVVLQRDTDTVITVKADISPIGASQPGTPGSLIVIMPAETNTVGTGQSSGSSIVGRTDGYKDIPGVRVFKTHPYVALDTLSSTGLADGRLLRFKITASPAGPVQLGRLAFGIACTNVTSGELGLYAYVDSAYSAPLPVRPGGRIGISPSGCIPNTFNVAPIPPIDSSAPVVIPAGATMYFELRSSLSLSGGSASAVTTLLGDGASPYPALVPLGSLSGNFGWSPNTYTTSAYGDSDWTNGYGIPGFPASGITQVRTGTGTPLPPPPPPYSQATYYSQGAYYSQSYYYGQSYYYSQPSYFGCADGSATCGGGASSGDTASQIAATLSAIAAILAKMSGSVAQ